VRRVYFAVTLLLAFVALVPAATRAQVSSSYVLTGTTLPSSCSRTNVVFHLTATDGSNAAGFYRCNGTTYVSAGGALPR
jgi:hypothetical protein